MTMYKMDSKEVVSFSKRLARVDKDLAYDFHMMTGMGILNRVANILTKEQFDSVVETLKDDAREIVERDSKTDCVRLDKRASLYEKVGADNGKV